MIVADAKTLCEQFCKNIRQAVKSPRTRRKTALEWMSTLNLNDQDRENCLVVINRYFPEQD